MLPFDADGLGAFLEETGLIDDEHGLGMPEVLDDIGPQIVADLIGIPVGGSEQPLDPIGGRGAHVFSNLPAIFAFNRTDQRPYVSIRQLTGFRPHKVLGNPLMQGGQADRPPPNLRRIQVLHYHAIFPFL